MHAQMSSRARIALRGGKGAASEAHASQTSQKSIQHFRDDHSEACPMPVSKSDESHELEMFGENSIVHIMP